MPIEIRGKTGLTQTDKDVSMNYGFGLKNADHQGHKYISNDTIIPAGGTINLKGSEAQVAVRQIVNELMQREGNRRLMSDPYLRREAEERIVLRRGSIQDLMDSNIQSQRSQVDAAISKSNQGMNDVQLPELSGGPTGQPTEGSRDTGTEGITQERRAPGRPKKTQ